MFATNATFMLSLTRIFNAITKPYASLPGYMTRRTLVKIGRLHIRIHVLHSDDATPFLHNHPFNYCSLLLTGGYTEECEEGKNRRVKKNSLIIHSHKFFHRIKNVEPGTITLFCTWETNSGWDLKRAKIKDSAVAWIEHKSGVYSRTLSGVTQYSKFDGWWFKGRSSVTAAMAETAPSINQTATGTFVCGVPESYTSS